MRVELAVLHRPAGGDRLRRALEDKFGPHDPSYMRNSSFLRDQYDRLESLIYYCGETPQYRISCYPAKDDEMQVVVEPISGLYFHIFQSAWDGIRSALAGHRPRLDYAMQVDDNGKEIQKGVVGLGAEVTQAEVLLPLVLMAAAVAWVVLGLTTFASTDRLEFAGGALTTVVAGLFALVLLAVNWRRSRLRWTGTTD